MFVKLNYLFMIKTGIIGTSETACNYATIIRDSGDLELTGCFSPDYSRNKDFASLFNLVAYPSLEALFNYADALIITDFAPGFIPFTEKALKNFKHILITNPFLAGFEEIQYLRKISEESGVTMQIAGGFKFHSILKDCKDKISYFADLKHSFNSSKDKNGARYMDFLLQDISLLLTILKGMHKKVSVSSWDLNGRNPDFMSARIDLDNGFAANILINQMENKKSFTLDLFNNDGVCSYNDCNSDLTTSSELESISIELGHFIQSITNHCSPSNHNDIMFQSLELVHTIKAKTIRPTTANIQNQL